MLGRSLGLASLLSPVSISWITRSTKTAVLPLPAEAETKMSLLPVVDRRLLFLTWCENHLPLFLLLFKLCFHVGVGQLDFLVVIQGLIEAGNV